MDYNAWLAKAVEQRDAQRIAVGVWRNIQRAPNSLVLIRAGVAQPVQTVRMEHDSSILTNDAPTRLNVRQRVVVFGVKDHPTQADTDIVSQDRFIYERREYEVKTVLQVIGGVQAFAEALE